MWQRLAVPRGRKSSKKEQAILAHSNCKNAELGIAGRSAEAPQGPSERAATPGPIQSRYSLEPKWLRNSAFAEAAQRHLTWSVQHMSRSTPGKDTRCESKTEALVAASWQLFANTYAHGCHERIDGASRFRQTKIEAVFSKSVRRIHTTNPDFCIYPQTHYIFDKN